MYTHTAFAIVNVQIYKHVREAALPPAYRTEIHYRRTN